MKEGTPNDESRRTSQGDPRNGGLAQILKDLKRILFLDRFYFPDEQATAVYLTELTRGLREQFEFEVLCGPPLVVTEQCPATAPPARVYQVPCLNLPKRILFVRLINDISFLMGAFFRGLFVPRPDLLVSQTSPPGVWWVGFLLSRWHRARWVHVYQDFFPDNLKVLNGNQNEIFFSFLDQVFSFPLKKSDRMLVVGEDMRKRLVRKGFPSARITRTHNWADLEFIRPLSKKNSFIEKYQLEGKFVVLYAGNFGRIYNFDDLLSAAEMLKGYQKIIFVMVGKGALRETILHQTRSRGLANVLIVPFEPRSRLPEVLASADVSVVLLRKGMAGLSVPSKIYSLLASGRPILACVEEESDIARMVRESNSGFAVPPGDPKELAGAVRRLFENPDLRNTLGQNARRYAESENFQRRALRDYERAFREALEAR